MTDLVPTEDIERIVGAPRAPYDPDQGVNRPT
jgi:hypothetical protein